MSPLPSRQQRREFLESRQKGLGSSDIPAILGIDPFRSAFDVYLSKTRPIPEDEIVNVHQLRGILLEPDIADLYSEFSHRPVRQIGTSVHPEEPWARANADRMTVVGYTEDQPLEIKAPGREKYAKILESGMEEAHIVQMHWEMWVVGHAVCSVPYERATFAAGNLEHSRGPVLYYDLEANPILFEQIADRARAFWHNHVLARVMPRPEDWERPALEVPEHDGERHVLGDEVAMHVASTMMKRYQLRKVANRLYDESKAEMHALLEARGITKADFPGVGKVNDIWRAGRTGFDHKRLREYGALDPDKVVRYLDGEIECPSTLEGLLDKLSIDFSRFEKQYDASQALTPYPAKDDG